MWKQDSKVWGWGEEGVVIHLTASRCPFETMVPRVTGAVPRPRPPRQSLSSCRALTVTTAVRGAGAIHGEATLAAEEAVVSARSLGRAHIIAYT